MRAAILRGPLDVVVDHVPDAGVQAPDDAVVRVVAAAICGTDLRGYCGQPGPVQGPRCGHEFVGVVEEIGANVRNVRVGNLVVAPFVFADGTCAPCRSEMFGGCRNGGMFGVAGDGGQAEAVRVPFADATLVTVPMDERDERLPAVLALADVMSTGQHGIIAAGTVPGSTVAVIGDGAVGLCAVLAARRAGAAQILFVGHHAARASMATGFGATEVLDGNDALTERVLDRTGGLGVDVVVDCVGEQDSMSTAFVLCRDGGTVSIVGGPHGELNLMTRFLRNVTVTGGLAPARRYQPELLADVLSGALDPSPIFDLEVSLAQVDDGYQAMRARTAVKVLVRP
ncbi:alcohol dehydrogenase catalytic domain-containing protein [Amycolatopsis sp. cg5]|uniref:zinc-binding dehydrogenase n=1 Tax=Amycolatopsis sp. cg5 TaxID=3238802 RepID=UPI003524BD61